MKIRKTILLASAALLALAASSCKDEISYADLLNVERRATNAYLADHRVVNEIPSDSIFETGEDAPFYRLVEDGSVYMQVVKPGDRKNNRAKSGEKIYFRYMRYNLEYWYSYNEWEGEGNERDMSLSTSFFAYQNYNSQESMTWGYGLQLPLDFLGVDCEVNLIIKSQYGVTTEYAYVQPYLYHVRYFKGQV